MERLCALSTATLSTDVSGAKAESHLEVIQGHAFWDHWKADEGQRITV